MDSIELFWSKVRKTPTCWISLLSKDKDGYAQLHRAGKRTTAHRFSWTIHNGAIPNGMFVLHKCDNPPCVRPSHLFLGTQQDNVADRDRKGRTNRWANGARQGVKNPRSILNEGQVKNIREAHARGIRRKDIAKAFGISIKTVDSIIYRLNWKHI